MLLPCYYHIITNVITIYLIQEADPPGIRAPWLHPGSGAPRQRCTTADPCNGVPRLHHGCTTAVVHAARVHHGYTMAVVQLSKALEHHGSGPI